VSSRTGFAACTCTVTMGERPIGMVEGLSDLRNVPVIVEADYRRSSIDEVRKDLMQLERLAK
jgi:hypothetical protein